MEKKRPVAPVVWRTLRLGLLIYAGLVILLGVMQRGFIYYPATDEFAALEAHAERQGLEPWRLETGEAVGWRPLANEAEPRLVVFHGNAGHALLRTYYSRLFSDVGSEGDGWDVYLFEYPGYGAREGRPSEEAFYRSAGEAVDELIAEDPERPLFLLGESLGSGVACRMAAERPEEIDGLLLVTPFSSLAEVGAAHFPFLPVRLLLRDRYENARHLEAYAGPLAVLVAGRDRVVPARFGRGLYENYAGPGRLWKKEDADHNTLLDFAGPDVWGEMAEFLLSDFR